MNIRNNTQKLSKNKLSLYIYIKLPYCFCKYLPNFPYYSLVFLPIPALFSLQFLIIFRNPYPIFPPVPYYLLESLPNTLFPYYLPLFLEETRANTIKIGCGLLCHGRPLRDRMISLAYFLTISRPLPKSTPNLCQIHPRIPKIDSQTLCQIKPWTPEINPQPLPN